MYIFTIFIVICFLMYSYFLADKAYKSVGYMFLDSVWRISIVLAVIINSWQAVRLTLQEGIFIGISLTVVYIIAHYLGKFYRVSNSPYFIFVAVVGAPIAEELLFRGWILNAIEGDIVHKIVMSSVIFGLYHIKNYFIKGRASLIYQNLYATFIVGPLFGWIALSTSSVFIPIILHSINNMLAITVSKKYFRKIIEG